MSALLRQQQQKNRLGPEGRGQAGTGGRLGSGELTGSWGEPSVALIEGPGIQDQNRKVFRTR